MAFMSFKNVAIAGIAACVPKKVVKNIEQRELVSEHVLKKMIETTGVIERRTANNCICASDLCYEATLRLFDDMKIDKSSIDVLIFVSQTADFRIPPTAPILQHRLGLSKGVAAFDINLGCSGYVYGLSLAYSFLSQSSINRALLLVGDTLSKAVSPKDRATAFLFGDGGTATLIEKRDDAGNAYFSLNSDGAGENVLKIKAGGYRYPSNIDTLAEKKYDGDNFRTDEQLYMDGAEVFNFTIREVPDDIKKILVYSQTDLKDIDFIFYHQSNKFIMDFLSKKIGIPAEKTPYSIEKYGNSSCPSIPLTMVCALKNKVNKDKKKIILCGYGVGLSWATVLLDISYCYISDVFEV